VNDTVDLPTQAVNDPVEATRGRGSAPPSASARDVWVVAAEHFAAYRAGEREALDRLVRLMTPTLWHVARAHRIDPVTAEDVVQNTWLALVRNAEAIDDPRAVVRWLTVTARREAWRSARTAGRAEPTPAELFDIRESDAEDPESAAVRESRDDLLWTAVARLSERCRHLVRIVAFVERPNYADVSEALGMPVGSIGPTRARCLAKLRALLADVDWRTA